MLEGFGVAGKEHNRLRQDRHGGVVAVQPPGGQDMRLNSPEERRQHRAATTHLVGQGRQAERYARPGVAFGLAIQRLSTARTS